MLRIMDVCNPRVFSEEVRMSVQSSANASRLEQLQVHLKTERYSPSIQRQYLPLAQYFFAYLERKTLSVDAFREAMLEDFFRWEQHRFRSRNGRMPHDLGAWRGRYRRVAHMVLRLAHGHWPIATEPTTTLETFHRDAVHGYDLWMRELRGLAATTRSRRITEARCFLTALGPRGDQEGLKQLNAHDIDSFVKQRSAGLRRATVEGCTGDLRSFLRYLHGSGRTAFDLSDLVIGPRIYDDEQIPSALRPEEVQKLLHTVRKDRSPIGRRDQAFLMLLSVYGLRAGEIIALRLEDFDWKKEVLRVQHSKTGGHSELPLLPEPAEAVLSYLQECRPESGHREVFIRLQAPYRPYKDGSILGSVMATRLSEAGIVPSGKKGPHALRHARAASLLRAGVPLKTIGDVLGHRSAKSTAAYLKLGTEGLRAVGLEVPKGVSP
jgi:integrase/recombinase XerD